MRNEKKNCKEIILNANRQVHTALAESGEYNRSPHFKKENQIKVSEILNRIINDIEDFNSKMLDLGCGTGFIIHLALALDKVDEIHGVDITDSMMACVDKSSGKVHLHNAEAENTPFSENTFSLVTAYSFLDHLEDHNKVLEEAFRVLRPGGVFYSDLNPNKHFGKLMLSLETSSVKPIPEIVNKEIIGMIHNGEHYEDKFGINRETLENAEPLKTFEHGFDPDEIMEKARKIGFSKVSYEYDWYLGQATVLHGQSLSNSNIIENHLRTILPSSRALFKYIRLILIK